MSAADHAYGDSAILARYTGPSDRLPKTAVVRWTTVVLVMAAEFGVKGFLLLSHRIVPVLLAPGEDRFQPSTEPFGDRLHVHCELPFRLRAHICVKPRKSKVSGFFPCRLAFLAAYRPNSISRVFSGCSVKPYFSNRFGRTLNTFFASSLCWKHRMASAKRIS
jgi:hypothetical protein